jgi:hypothetical protein
MPKSITRNPNEVRYRLSARQSGDGDSPSHRETPTLSIPASRSTFAPAQGPILSIRPPLRTMCTEPRHKSSRSSTGLRKKIAFPVWGGKPGYKGFAGRRGTRRPDKAKEWRRNRGPRSRRKASVSDVPSPILTCAQGEATISWNVTRLGTIIKEEKDDHELPTLPVPVTKEEG